MSLLGDKNRVNALSGSYSQSLNVGGDLIVEGEMGIKILVRGPKMFVRNITSLQFNIAGLSDTAFNVMENFLQHQNETITWEGVIVNRDTDDADVDGYTLKVSKDTGSGFVEQDISTNGSSKEIDFLIDVDPIRVPFDVSFNSISGDIIKMELESDDNVDTEEVGIYIYGFYTR